MHLVGFIEKKFITKHGYMNIKKKQWISVFSSAYQHAALSCSVHITL